MGRVSGLSSLLPEHSAILSLEIATLTRVCISAMKWLIVKNTVFSPIIIVVVNKLMQLLLKILN